MTDEELNEIEKRCAAARTGPWTSYVEGRDHTAGSNIIKVGPNAEPDDDIDIIGATIADQDFIAYARSDIPKLINEIRRLNSLISSD